MTYKFSDDQIAIRDAITKVCSNFDATYWLECDKTGNYPQEFADAICEGGWLGIAMPEEFGGAGMGITEASIMMQAVAQSGAGFTGASAIHLSLFGLNPVLLFGTEEQKQRMLPPTIQGKDISCFGVTEPNAGLDTTNLQVRAIKEGDGYVIHGQKHWSSMAQRANKVLLLARTTPRDEVKKKTDGLSLFYTDLNRDYVEIQEIEKMGRKAVDSNAVFYDGMPVPQEDLIGEEGKGFRYILHGLNPERILLAAEAVGLGRAALKRAVDYAKERVVFGRPIGSNQGIQHPLAKNWMELEAANLMAFTAAAKYDAEEECGAEANTAKYLAAEAGYSACEQAILTHGGMGYAKEYHVERYLREMMIPRIAPVSREMIFNFIGEKVLGLPRSF
ncbi:MAG: acyl-CoA/acyl-ACP dehydrogenase [Gammaproteobacteria bacterium]|jgi:acyl-CoA dehydrogenase|nr:acyl-CoA/acyl-ACP dehydrogenase [Gammaproteobacteria bacterium]|tara:strand:- start:907 stop:2073 length:1167 start_codon:yes stop_codon:yes gene_type:complete